MADYQFSDSNHLRKLYAIHQGNFALLDSQIARSAGTPRADVVNQAADERAAMLAIVAELRRRSRTSTFSNRKLSDRMYSTSILNRMVAIHTTRESSCTKTCIEICKAPILTG